MGQWIGFALEGVDYLSKLLEVLPFPPGIAGPISLAAPIAAAVQFAWKVLRETGREHKRRVLREKAVGLHEFIASLPAENPSSDEARAGRDARTEWTTALEELALLGRRMARGVDEAVQQRHWLRQALLLYAPRPGALWLLHAAFYFCVIEIAAMVSVLVVTLLQGDVATAAGLAPAMSLFIVPAVIFWGLAADLDRGTTRSRNALQRLLLAYAPDGRGRWAWHVAFYISLAAVISILGIVPQGGEDLDGLLLGGGVWLLLLLLSRAMAAPGKSPRSWWRRCLLAYAPKRRLAWFFHVAFWTSLIGTMAALVVGVATFVRGEEGALPDLLEAAYIAVVTTIVWGLATDLEQRQVAPPAGVRRALLLYVPARRSLWVSHLFSYLCAVTVIVGVREIVTGEFQTSPPSFVAVPILYFVLAGLVSRGVSLGLEPGATMIPPPAAWLRIGKQPRSWTMRALFWLGAAVFYASVFLLPLVLYLTLEGSAAVIVRVLVPLVAIGSAARWIVHRICDRQETIESPLAPV